MKKLTSIFLSILILLNAVSCITITAYADQQNNNPNIQSSQAFEINRNDKYVSNDRFISGNYEYVMLKDSTISISRYKGEDKSIVIPSVIDGKTVSDILCYAFAYNEYVESVTIPGTVKSLGEFAFMYCKNLEVINLSEGLETLAGYSFSHIPKLKKIYIPSTVKSIGTYGMVYDSPSIESIEVSPKNTKYSSKDGVLFNKSKTKLLVFPCAKKVNSYKIPSSVIAIPETAFRGCSQISKLVIWDNLKNFNTIGFIDLTGVKEFTVSKKNKYFCSKNGVLFDKKVTRLYRYPAKKKTKSYTIPKTVTTVYAGAFYNNKYITTIKMSKKVRYIDFRAELWDAEKRSPFSGCKNLKNVYYSGSKKDWNKIYYYDRDYDYETGKTSAEKEYFYQKSNGGSSLRFLMNNAKIHYNAKV